MAIDDKLLEEILLSQNIPTDGETFVDIVYGGAFSIRDYYMESGNPRQMRGASQLLIEAAELGKYSNSKYFTCGAESFFIVPHGKGAKTAARFERDFQDKTLTARAAVVSQETELRALQNKEEFRKLWIKINELFHERRMLIFPSLEISEGKERCVRCNFREPTGGEISVAGTKMLLCPSCYAKHKKGGEARSKYIDECLEFAEEHKLGLGAITAFKAGYAQTTNDLSAKPDDSDGIGDIALLYADINNLGGIGEEFSGNLSERKVFTQAVKEAVTYALYCAVLKGSDRSINKKFEIIAAGGDDICVLLPGDVALLVGTQLLEEFDKQLTERSDMLKQYEMKISAGIAVGKANTPLVYMREAAEQLLKIAKEEAHRTGESCLDIISLNSDSQWATQINKKLRADLKIEEGTVKAIRTMRPFTVGAARRMLNWISQLENISSSTLYRIAEASMKLGIEEGNLWFNYLLSKQPSSERSLANLAKAISSDCKMYTKTDGDWRSPWRDLAELRGQRI
ncbi:MAG: hypothetical protein LBB91_09035 [Clostridiales bacterium]|jgi:hypothetical protein|nr:hypothetical protein [Clostridiales bacterium]